MFCIIDKDNNFAVVKSGFKTASKANDWAKKNLPRDQVRLWGKYTERWDWSKHYRYHIEMKR